MDSVNCVNCQQSRVENRYKGLKHVANAAVTTGGIVGTGLLLKKGARMMSEATDMNRLTKNNATVRNIFEKLGEKIFKGKIGRIFERYDKAPHLSPAEFAKGIKFNKGCVAMVLTASIAALGILARGIYKAGKINGEQ